jgi:hypothetical protein
MEYSEEKANEVYQRHPDTRPDQRRVWKSRNKIPDRYFDDKAVIRKRVRDVSAVEDKKQDRLALVLASEKFYTIRFSELAELKWAKHTVSEFTRGKMTLNDEERLKLTTEVQKFRAELRNALTLPPSIGRKRKLLALAGDLRIVKKVVFGKALGDKVAPSRKPEPSSFSEDEFAIIEQQLAVILLETSL